MKLILAASLVVPSPSDILEGAMHIYKLFSEDMVHTPSTKVISERALRWAFRWSRMSDKMQNWTWEKSLKNIEAYQRGLEAGRSVDCYAGDCPHTH